MDEYIKREDAIDAVLYALVCTGVQSRDISAIREVSAADVVPKSECKECGEKANKVIVDLQKQLAKVRADNEYILMQHRFQRRPSGDCWNDVIEKAKTEVAREIFAEIDNFLIKTVGEFDKALDKAIREDKYGLASLYSDEKNLVITLKIAIAELKKKYTEVNHDGS